MMLELIIGSRRFASKHNNKRKKVNTRHTYLCHQIQPPPPPPREESDNRNQQRPQTDDSPCTRKTTPLKTRRTQRVARSGRAMLECSKDGEDRALRRRAMAMQQKDDT